MWWCQSQVRECRFDHLRSRFTFLRWRPEILILGTGKSTVQLPPTLRNHLSQAGIQVDVMDTVRVWFALAACIWCVLTTIVVERLLYV